jgi:class 3 adenylate cyclase
MKSAVQSNAIVSSLFPKTVRDRLFPSSEHGGGHEKSKIEYNKTRLKSFLSGDGKSPEATSKEEGKGKSSPIADLFPHCTVLFSDIAGFTAWSSAREPTQVFTLLENVYGAFDAIAARRGVFKVETIGDAYVAVVGLPEPRDDHAVVMAKFARDCRLQMMELVRDLEKSLGPGTGDLKLRFGLHSGAVTAGVLRGQKSRFQLFGDTVNTASRMESTGVPHQIQASSTTAELLIAAGKGSWLKPREDLVEAKGKGKLQTYWIDPKLMGATATTASESSTDVIINEINETMDDKTKRLVDWNSEVLARLIKQIVARRNAIQPSQAKKPVASRSFSQERGMTVLDEVKEIIEIQEFDASTYSRQMDPEAIELDAQVMTQLREYVIAISSMYNEHAFHSFAHASHVCMSVAKLLGRIVAPEMVITDASQKSDDDIGSEMHDHTYGIASDPLAQFACVFSALIHDVDHPGVPNSRLVQEESPMALEYKGKSVAEQNSVDIGWTLLMGRKYSKLRQAICPTKQELLRFRQLVVNIVMATDIVDTDLKQLRDNRWDKAFSESFQEPERDRMNRKATIVIEHLIQASDVAHTMQHWHIYSKWNEKLFEELYVAFKEGRSDTDPSEFWYKGELAFFDGYILPLAKKLRDCGVFGVSSDEYLMYALKNREEWEARGAEVLANVVKKLKQPPSA